MDYSTRPQKLIFNLREILKKCGLSIIQEEVDKQGFSEDEEAEFWFLFERWTWMDKETYRQCLGRLD